MIVELRYYNKWITDGSTQQKHFKININTICDKILTRNAVLIMLSLVDVHT